MKIESQAVKSTPVPVFTGLISLFFIFIFTGYIGRAGTAYQPDLVPVPPYLGMQLEQALSRMPNDRLRQGEITEIYSDALPGTVVGQFPEPEMMVDPGTQINLEVSLGPPPQSRVEVPNVTGLNNEEAETVLRESGLRTGHISERLVGEREPGIILEQSPQPGTVVMENIGVDLIVSIRDFRIIVPDLISMRQEKAIRVLQENGLNYALYYENSGQPKNIVIKQEPDPGTRVDEGALVVLTIAQKKQFSPWLFFGGFLAIAVLGGFAGYRLKKTKTEKNRLTGKKIDLAFKPVWEAGRQNVKVHGEKLTDQSLRIKYIQDSGSSTILKPQK